MSGKQQNPRIGWFRFAGMRLTTSFHNQKCSVITSRKIDICNGKSGPPNQLMQPHRAVPKWLSGIRYGTLFSSNIVKQIADRNKHCTNIRHHQ